MGFLYLLLFGGLAGCALALAYPGRYGDSPLGHALDAARRRLESWLVRGDRALYYEVTGRDPLETIRPGVLIGLGAGLVAVLLTRFPLGLLLAVLLLAGTVLVYDAVMVGEYRRWQSRLLDGVPALTQFMPSFLETGAVSTRAALELTVPFLPEPLKGEMSRAVNQLARTGSVAALDGLAARAGHPVVDTVCFRLSAAWDVGARPDIFADLADQIRNLEEVAAARATAARSGLIALVCVVGLIGAFLEFGYPAWAYFTGMMGGVFGN